MVTAERPLLHWPEKTRSIEEILRSGMHPV